MDNGFKVGDITTNTCGTCPSGTDTRFCGAFLEAQCGTANLKGATTATMHMLLSDCGGHGAFGRAVLLACACCLIFCFLPS